MIRYAGVFAPNSHLREEIRPKEVQALLGAEEQSSHGSGKGWAKMMKRVFDIDVLQCPHCHSRMQRIAFITEGQAIRDILASIGLATAPPEPAKPCWSEQQECFSFDGIA